MIQTFDLVFREKAIFIRNPFFENGGLHKYTKGYECIVRVDPMSAEERLVLVTAKEDVMKLWKFNKRSSTLADMSMNRVLLTELIAKVLLLG